eukprot:TRINITY_DN83669_c0_g1_i1.p1 TRINITY_DN83669_c0_g1~~TRINITY_DN83669_c0_g1_i1.p1  ORF type:complete len:110 (-),score=14.43 TRINITY_DN83669_c0_g1_i1:255-563(-)
MAELVKLDASMSSDGKSSMTTDDYRLQCCREVFPTLSDEVCLSALDRARVACCDEAAVHALIEKAGHDNLEPLGYMAYDFLIEEHGDKMVKRAGCSLHHPFD